MLLAGRVRPRLVAAGGLLTAVGFAALRRLAVLYLPDLVASNQQQFGLLGVAFTLFSWLSASAFVIVVTTVVGAVLAEDPGRLGRFIRTRMSAPHPLRVMPIAALVEIPISNLATVCWNRPSTATRGGRDDGSTGWAAAGQSQAEWRSDRFAHRRRGTRDPHHPKHREGQIPVPVLAFTWPLWWYTIMTALFGALVWFGLGRDGSSRAPRGTPRSPVLMVGLLVNCIGRGLAHERY